MKKKHIGILPLLFVAIPVFAATIRVYNKLGNNKNITVTTITSKKRITEPVESMRSHLFNTWFEGIEGFEWESNGYTYAAPLSMRALQTEGRLYIQKDGQYSFQPCLPCKESKGKAQVIKSPEAQQPSSIPNPPPMPPIKTFTIPTPPPLPPAPTTGKKPQALLEDIQKGKQLRPMSPAPQKPVSPQDKFIGEIQAGKKLTPAAQRQLAPKPDTRTSRDKLLQDIQSKPALRKVGAPLPKTVPTHEMHDPLSKAIDARRKQLEQIGTTPADDEDAWADEDE